MSKCLKLDTKEPSLTATFELTRRTGKNQSLAKGNQIINSNDRMHFIVKSKITDYLRQLARKTMTSESYSREAPYYSENRPCLVLVTVYPPTHRRFDAPNIYPTVKALIDGMTDAGVWSDDNNKIIKAISFTCGGVSGSKAYKVEISISEV